MIISLLKEKKVKALVPLCDPMDCNPPGFSVHGNSQGKNTGVGSHSLLQGIFLTQELNLGLPHCRQILYHLSHQFSSVAQSCPTLCNPINCSTPGPCPSPTPRVYSNSCLLSQWCHPAISSSVVPFSSHLQSFPASGSFSMSQFLPNYWSFSFNISPSNELSGLISFRMDWLDLLAIQGTLESLLQHHSSKASNLRRSAFFIVQLSHPYMTTRKTIALTRQTFVVKGMSLLFNMLSRLFITFLPRSKHLLISWLQSPSAVILEPKKIKSVSFHYFPIYLPWSDGTRCHDLRFLNVEL